VGSQSRSCPGCFALDRILGPPSKGRLLSPHITRPALSPLLLLRLCPLIFPAGCSSCLLTAFLQTILALIPLFMADTCIVCLGDLGESASDSLAIAAEAVPRPDLQIEGKSSDASTKTGRVDDNEDAGQIAQLLPCGHILHNNCLKPWVERANSCPICRRSFNLVELRDRLGGMSFHFHLTPT
jgi:hypothetical protein